MAADATLEALFVMEWQVTPDAPLVVPPGDRDGVLLGSGDGKVTGDRVTGTLRFSMYSAECPMDPGFLQELGVERAGLGDHVCRVTPGGVIETDDGARIQFDVKGFGLRLSKPEVEWSLTGGIRFATEAARYRWLNRTLGLWDGEFFEDTGRARYRVHGRFPATR